MLTEQMQRKLLLLILDGVGTAPKSNSNAVTLSEPSNLISYWNNYPHTYLRADSQYVGLPENTKGNSEVGHLNIGAGNIIYQSLPRINRSIKRGDIATNSALLESISKTSQKNSNIHLMGCLSDGGVHSHIEHFIALISAIHNKNPEIKIRIHGFLDGRDTPPKSAEQYINYINESLKTNVNCSIVTLCGRAFAMDRNQALDRTKKAFELVSQANGVKYKDTQSALIDQYTKIQSDEYLNPSVIGDYRGIEKNDIVIFVNFRADRAIQLSKMLISNGIDVVGMYKYAKDIPEKALFPKEYVRLPLGRIISDAGLTQLRIAETEKFPHVTYFFNGGTPLKYKGEIDIEIPSKKVETYDLLPEMSLPEMTEELISQIKSDRFNFIVANIANGDMLGHTGNIDATVKSMRLVDKNVKQIVDAQLSRGGDVIITADHGNSDEMVNLQTGKMDTEHSINPVPFIHIQSSPQKEILKLGKLSNIAPTILKIMGIKKPSQMSGLSLI